ncbi:hypothetical protein N7474_005930 [Penicillium riverlandense]|uniref:uncharacterized protein n=1 Tax=Penicillium riverlandense TaxID=1903569 RepID=UPI002547BED8|nr:uncharacterized protein N7474_005930 [Penicillium riverlandense]KAJ5820339.1 hypothetical protein N7474_005930 [Penicillium riverlandense]
MAISLPPGFQIEPVQFVSGVPAPTIASPLGLLENFSESFTGRGLNTVFRPNNGTPDATQFPRDNILELNLINDTITFSESFGAVPNRGLMSQNGIFLNGISYIQAVNDVTNVKTGRADGPATGIHFETGLWMNVPATNNTPVLGDSLVRMASIPHGTTINAQCLAPTRIFKGPPDIPKANLSPFPSGGGDPVPLKSLNASHISEFRLPHDLSKFIAAGTITQDILDDPNTVLREAIEGQNITHHIVFTVSTAPLAPEFGGGTANIAFLEGNAASSTPNANVMSMNATFWIETVQYELEVPIFKPGQAPIKMSPASRPDKPAPVFVLSPPHEITAPKRINVTSIQIQYSQVILMIFDQLAWPHVSVSTLIPSQPVSVPDSVWS